MAFKLQIQQGPGAGQTLEFDQPEVTFGRVDGNDVVIRDPNISRKHFHIVDEGGTYVLRDLGSSNGTGVNGGRVSEHTLSTGDQIMVGPAVILFEGPGGAPKQVARRQRAAAAPAAPRGGGDEAPAPVARRSRGGDSGGGAVSARERFKQKQAGDSLPGKFAKLPMPAKIGVIAGPLVLIGLVVLMTGGGGEGGGGVFATDYSGEILELVPQVSEACFGYKVKGCDQKAKTDIGYKFQYIDGRATLTFDAGWIDEPQEVEIILNEDTTVGYMPVTMSNWDSGLEIILPYDRLKQNDVNTIVFNSLKNRSGGKTSSWAVRNVTVTEDPLPEPDPRIAQERYDIALKLWEQRKVAPENLAGACRNFDDARNYLEKMIAKPPLYDEATARAKECEKILAKKFKEIRGTLKKYENFKQWEKLRGGLELCVKYFPEDTDSRHKYCAEWLERFR